MRYKEAAPYWLRGGFFFVYRRNYLFSSPFIIAFISIHKYAAVKNN
jgi:hypothetical protein